MNIRQEEFLKRANEQFALWNDAKFRAGDAEHEGDIKSLSPFELIENAIDECLDQFNFLLALREAHLERTPVQES